MIGILAQLVLGVLVIVFRDQIAGQAMHFQNDFWGFKFGEKEVKATKLLAWVGGLYSIGDALFLLLKR